MPELLAVLAAAIGGLSYVIQHLAVQGTSPELSEIRALASLLRNPRWLLGIVLLFVGFCCQAAALAIGNVVIVMPILVLTLIFVLPFSRLIAHVTPSPRDWLGAILVAGAVVVFLLSADPGKPNNQAGGAWWALAFFGFMALNVALIVGGERAKPAAGAALIGTAAGVCNALVGPFTGAALVPGQIEVLELLVNPYFYGMCVAAFLAMAIAQLAFRKGPITAAMPTITAVPPVLGVLLGIWLFGEKLHDSTGDLLVLVGCGIVMVVGTVLVAHSKVLVAEPARL